MHTGPVLQILSIRLRHVKNFYPSPPPPMSRFQAPVCTVGWTCLWVPAALRALTPGGGTPPTQFSVVAGLCGGEATPRDDWRTTRNLPLSASTPAEGTGCVTTRTRGWGICVRLSTGQLLRFDTLYEAITHLVTIWWTGDFQIDKLIVTDIPALCLLYVHINTVNIGVVKMIN